MMSKEPFETPIDRTTALCLACSSSLPPMKANIGLFITNCCNRPICPVCISSNPRLARYDPCLACLCGVGVICAGSNKGKGSLMGRNVNVDGAVREEDTFVLGDAEDDESGDEHANEQDSAPYPPPPYTSSGPDNESTPATDSSPPTQSADDKDSLKSNGISSSNPYKYYIRPNDNLQGIAMRFGVAGRELCRLNNLPPSSLSTTPHILHTRVFITLPLSARFPTNAKSPVSIESTVEDREREQRIARERAEKRLQTLTKEVDWRVAKAYVALTDADADSSIEGQKESTGKRRSDALENRAIDRYMDDEEWEEREHREGRQTAIPPFPYFGNVKSLATESSSSSNKLFWRWRK